MEKLQLWQHKMPSLLQRYVKQYHPSLYGLSFPLMTKLDFQDQLELFDSAFLEYQFVCVLEIYFQTMSKLFEPAHFRKSLVVFRESLRATAALCELFVSKMTRIPQALQMTPFEPCTKSEMRSQLLLLVQYHCYDILLRPCMDMVQQSLHEPGVQDWIQEFRRMDHVFAQVVPSTPPMGTKLEEEYTKLRYQAWDRPAIQWLQYEKRLPSVPHQVQQWIQQQQQLPPLFVAGALERYTKTQQFSSCSDVICWFGQFRKMLPDRLLFRMKRACWNIVTTQFALGDYMEFVHTHLVQRNQLMLQFAAWFHPVTLAIEKQHRAGLLYRLQTKQTSAAVELYYLQMVVESLPPRYKPVWQSLCSELETVQVDVCIRPEYTQTFLMSPMQADLVHIIVSSPTPVSRTQIQQSFQSFVDVDHLLNSLCASSLICCQEDKYFLNVHYSSSLQ